MSYFGIHIPLEKQTAIDEKPPYVFDNRDAAFQFLKKHRDGRVKAWQTEKEARSFSFLGIENTATQSTVTPESGSQSNGVKVGVERGEKVSSFRGPTSQELVKFRKSIEQGNFESVHDTVWANPRYLVGSGDTPSILKESFRYNALHVAALAKNAKICKLILETISDPKFVQLLHGKDDKRTAEDVSLILLDLYLNMPEKGRSETPLHLAAKYGAVDVVEVLTSYKECQMTPNSDRLFPKDMICFRIDSPSEGTVNLIKSLLQERFYVPVMRTSDNSLPPMIGEPFSPTQPLNKMADLLSPEMEVKALAGPMNKDQAETFRRRWKTPPRLTTANLLTSPPSEHLSLGSSSPLSSYPKTVPRIRHTPTRHAPPFNSSSSTPRKLFNGDNDGHEFDCSSPVSKLNIDDNRNEWQEPLVPEPSKGKLFLNYRQFRANDSMDDSFIGINKHHQTLNESIFDSPAYKERNLKLADVEKGLEVIGRGLAKDHNVGWKEHWDFLNEFMDISSADGLEKFEKYLSSKNEQKIKPPMSGAVSKVLTGQKREIWEMSPLSTICRDLSNIKSRIVSKLLYGEDNAQRTEPTSVATPTSPNACNAYQCVEKSCQVFAKRLQKQIGCNTRNIALINDALTCELNRLKSLVCSYKEDTRFFAVDFRSAHSRFAHLIVRFLLEDPSVITDTESVNEFQTSLQQILESKQKNCTSDNFQLLCLLKFLLQRLKDKEHLIAPETLTSEQDCTEVWTTEMKCECEWMLELGNKQIRAMKRRHENNKMNQMINDMNVYRDSKESDDEDDEFYESVSEPDDDSSEKFYTPPESPTELFFKSVDDYSNYIYGDVPTKMDNDVLIALHGLEIDRNLYPNVFKWHVATQKHSLEERNNFPPPLTGKQNSKDFNPKRLFQSTPTKTVSKPLMFQLKPSILSDHI